MTKKGKIILTAALAMLMIALVVYCVRFGKTPAEKQAEDPTVATEDALQAAAELASAAETAWKNGTAKRVTLSDDGSTASAPGVQIMGNTVTVTSSGIYSVSGTLNEGQLAVNCSGTVVLILENAAITDPAGAAICVSDADHTLIYLPEGSVNKVVSGTEREITATDENTDADAVSGASIYARDDLSVAGSGKLTVGGYINNAVATTDRLTVLGGELELEAVNNGLKGKDSVTVLDGAITVHSGGVGVKADNAEEADCGYIDIRGGEINVISLDDGIQAERNLSIADGIINVCAGDAASIDSGASARPFENIPEKPDGGMENGSFPPDGEKPPEIPDGAGQIGFPENSGDRGFPGDRGGMEPPDGEAPPEMPDGMRGGKDENGDLADRFDAEQSSGSEGNAKGLKSGGDLAVSGGAITVKSVGDSIHANGSITVTGGTLLLSTGDDGFHADDTLTVSSGNITVSQSYEGIEAHKIRINGGNICVTASDDGLNAGGSAVGGTDLPELKILGGTLYVNADGDGIDSNGDLIVGGGTVIVDGPTNGGNGALDSGTENGGTIVCNGGTVLAVGASDMAETFGNASAQCSFIKNFSGMLPAGTRITVSDESGKVIFEYESAKTFNSVVFSSPELVSGGSYTLTVGEQSAVIAVDSVSNGDVSGFSLPGDRR